MVPSSPLFRIAPTPSGWLHQGNLWNFLLIKHLARLLKGQILLRIDDLDNARFRTPYLENIFATLDLLQIEYIGPSGPAQFFESWSQHHRLDLYEQAIEQLELKKILETSSLSRKQLKENYMSPPPNSSAGTEYWYLSSTLFEPSVYINDQVKGRVQALIREHMPQIVVRKKDGLPSYQLASVVDDFHFKVSHIVRGEDLLPSTGAQIILAGQLMDGLWNPWWLHHPLLLDEQGNKLSKSAGKSTHAPQWTKSELTQIEDSVVRYIDANYSRLTL